MKKKRIKNNILILILWLIVGILTLVLGYITKLTYGCCWAVLIFYIIGDILKDLN